MSLVSHQAKGSDFFNRSMKSWLQDNDDIEMYSTHNEGKSAVAERFIRTLKNRIYKYVTAISKNVYMEKLIDIVNRYNNAFHKTIKMNPIDVKSGTHFGVGNNEKEPKFKIIRKNFLVLGEGLIHEINGSCGTPDKKISINFSETMTKCYFSLSYNVDNSYLHGNKTDL